MADGHGAAESGGTNMEDFLTWMFWIAGALILYAYVLFPLWLSLVAKLSRRTAACPVIPPDSELPRIAMIVAAYNEIDCIRDKIRNTLSLDYPRDKFHLYIGSDGSADGTSEFLETVDDRRVIAVRFAERRGKSAVINDLIARADAEILVMCDANGMFNVDALKQLIKHFEDPAVGCVSGEMCLDKDGGVSGEGLYWRFENWIKQNESWLGFLIGCNGGIYALRRSLFTPISNSTIVDDFVISLNVLAQGYRTILEPRACALEPACPSTRGEMARKARIGAGNWQALGMTLRLLSPRYGMVAAAYWGHKILRWATPVFLVSMIVAGVLLRRDPFFRDFALLNAGGVLVAAAASCSAISHRLPRFTRPVSYFYLMNYSLLCGLIRYIFKTQKTTWSNRASFTAPAPQVDYVGIFMRQLRLWNR